MTSRTSNTSRSTSTGRKRTRIVRPYPNHTLEDALTIAAAIQESNAGLVFDRVLLARALGTTPASSGFTMKLNSSAKYGLTQGAYNEDRISLTPRGETIVAPKGGDELSKALLEAVMYPEIFGRFYTMLDGKRLPADTYAQNMLQREFGIHPDLTGECLGIIKANGLYVGILKDDGDSVCVALKDSKELAAISETELQHRQVLQTPVSVAGPAVSEDKAASRPGRIFVGHSGNVGVVEFVMSVLDGFDIPYAIAEEDSAETKPIPLRVSDDMRQCTAGILVFGRTGPEESDVRTAEADMLYQLGAASVLFGDRIVILKDSNLELAEPFNGIRSVNFDKGTPEQSGLALLYELHRAGLIKVTA